eukprot:gnl/TRDRNA2_/TRDRNA2_43288_c0_seq1.p1 gnl/TRDRNA2_/TRDRNA2_43288_c0~~gnl/TRDRNA2_/TRDRNA2_43288_c0_seq1.p1  ORF type:complete len:310 (+),score=55.11 gnl/TRDRNA2_/TRDRNA2_43288_c0_seq1:47-976(+)
MRLSTVPRTLHRMQRVARDRLPGRCRRRLSLLAAAVFTVPFAAAEPCALDPQHITVANLSSDRSTQCWCCFDAGEFIFSHNYTYVLFYATLGDKNIEINDQFEELAKQWKWSRIAFGRFNVDNDPDMEPKSVTAMYRNGRAQSIKPDDFDRVAGDSPGSKVDGQKWMLTKYLGDDHDGTNLHYVAPMASNKKLQRFVETKSVAVVGHFRVEGEARHNVFLEVAWQFYSENELDTPKFSIASVTKEVVSRKENASVPSILVYSKGELVQGGVYDVYEMDKWTKPKLMAYLGKFLQLREENTDGKRSHAEL